VLLLARHAAAAAELAAAFRERRVVKYYVGLGCRKARKTQGRVVGDMGKARRGDRRLLRTADNPAETRFVTAGLPGLGAGLRGFVCRPVTGKTHQIRVAMRSVGAPVLGDARYGTGRDARRPERHPLGDPGGAVGGATGRALRLEWGAVGPAGEAGGGAWEDAGADQGAGDFLGWDRMYLHACAVRLRVGGSAVQVVSRPSEGALFRAEGFAEWFAGRFPPSMADDTGLWFPGDALLESALPDS